MILNGDGMPASLENVAADWMPKSMGDTNVVRDAISAVVPGVDWSDPKWGIYLGAGFSIEFNFQAAGPVDAFTLHIRGGGDPLPTIVTLCSRNAWVAYDYSTGEMIDLQPPARESWLAFQQYRDQITGRG
jgi:hypothetical protein